MLDMEAKFEKVGPMEAATIAAYTYSQFVEVWHEALAAKENGRNAKELFSEAEKLREEFEFYHGLSS